MKQKFTHQTIYKKILLVRFHSWPLYNISQLGIIGPSNEIFEKYSRRAMHLMKTNEKIRNFQIQNIIGKPTIMKVNFDYSADYIR